MLCIYTHIIYGVCGIGSALLNAPRQGPALPPTACQTIHNVVPTPCQGLDSKKKRSA